MWEVGHTIALKVKPTVDSLCLSVSYIHCISEMELYHKTYITKRSYASTNALKSSMHTKRVMTVSLVTCTGHCFRLTIECIDDDDMSYGAAASDLLDTGGQVSSLSIYLSTSGAIEADKLTSSVVVYLTSLLSCVFFTSSTPPQQYLVWNLQFYVHNYRYCKLALT